MDTKQFAKLIQAIVREETTRIVRKEMKLMKQELLKEINSAPRQRTKTKSTQGLSDSDIDSLVAARLAEMRGEKPKARKQPIQQKRRIKPKAEKFSNDSSLNSILEETAMYSDFSEHDDGRGWKTMNGGNAYDSKDALMKQYARGYDGLDIPEGMSQVPDYSGGYGTSVEEMLPDKDVRGMHMRVNADALPDGLKDALTRDYSGLMKVMNKSISDKKAKRGLDK